MLKLKFTPKDTSRPVVVLGLSEANVEKLKEGSPIHFAGEDAKMGELDVVIMHGETEQAMLDALGIDVGDAKGNGFDA